MLARWRFPPAIFRKPARLTEQEFELVKTHTIVGSEIVGPSPELEIEREVARHHHERWDGTGYPDGLRGEEIPLEARITAVADVFDALVARRPYKEPWPVERAIDYLRERSGTQFDPRVVGALLELHGEQRLRYPLCARVWQATAV